MKLFLDFSSLSSLWRKIKQNTSATRERAANSLAFMMLVKTHRSWRKVIGKPPSPGKEQDYILGPDH